MIKLGFRFFLCIFVFLRRRRDCLEDSDKDGCSLKLFPEEMEWHYITITPTRSDRRIEFAINVVITGKL